MNLDPKNKAALLVFAAFAAGCGSAAQAQESVLKLGVVRETTHSRTSGISGIGVPAGADAKTGDATTLLFTFERFLNPNFGVELALGVPPRIDARATGSVAFLGKVLSARTVSPTLFANYHFGAAGDTWRPYVGAGINYTRFVDIESSIAPSVDMSDSVGLALKAGVDYALNKQWGLFGGVSTAKVKSKLVASGSTVLTTTIDFRPVNYSFGVSYRF